MSGLFGLVLAVAVAGTPPPPQCAEHFETVDTTSREGTRCVYAHARATGDFDGAIALMLESVERHPEWAHALATLGALRMDQGELDQARIDMRAAADALQEQGHVTGEVYARLNLTLLNTQTGQLDDVRSQFARAVEAAAQAEDPGLLRTVESARLRTAWQNRLDLDLTLDRAIALHEQLTPEDNYQTRLVALHVAINVAAELGRDEIWLTYQPKLIELQRGKGDPYAESTTRSLALLYLQRRPELVPRLLGDKTLVEEAMEIAELARRGENPWTEVSVLYRAAAELPLSEAKPLMAQARAVAEELDEFRYVSDAELRWALAVGASEPEAALAVAERWDAPDLSVADRASVERIRFVSYHQLGDAAARDQAAEAFLIAGRDALDSGVDAGRSWRAEWDADFHDLAWVAMQEGRLAAAHHVIEGIRADAVRSALERANADDALIDDVQLRKDWAAARAAVEEAEEGLLYATEAGLASAQQSHRETRAQVYAIQDELDTRAPAYAALRRTEPVPLDAIQASLGPDEVLVALQAPASTATLATPWALVVRHDSVSQVPLPPRAEIDQKVAWFASVHGDNAVAAESLYDALLGKALRPDDKRVILIPESSLHQLPFAALRRTAEGPPLGAEVELVLAPSATLWSRWNKQEPRDGLVVGIGDPAFSESTAAQHLARLPKRLPQASREMEALAPLSAVIYEGSKATDSAWIVERPRLLHFAAHAVTPPQDPGSAGLLLAPSEGSDGWLSAEDVLRTDLDGAVVVLSACQSAGGSAVGAQGPEGLAQAFQQAGASAVLATLWPLRDDHAAEFFARFYGQIARGSTLGAALRETQRQLAEEGQPHEGWAGVVLIGNADIRLAEPPTPRPRGLLALLALLGLVSLGALGMRLRSR